MSAELILIVEDNEKNRKLARDVLQFKGYSTVDAETGEQALVLARSRQPALILMDIQLPGISGIEVLAQLRADAQTRDIPVIAVTASVMVHEQKLITQAGFDGFQRKPLDIKAFVAAVHDALEKRRQP